MMVMEDVTAQAPPLDGMPVYCMVTPITMIMSPIPIYTPHPNAALCYYIVQMPVMSFLKVSYLQQVNNNNTNDNNTII